MTTNWEEGLSAPMRRWVEQARELGLTVEVRGSDDPVVQSRSVTISRVRVEQPTNMLEIARNADALFLNQVRTFNAGRWAHSAHRSSYATSERLNKLALVRYWIEGFAR